MIARSPYYPPLPDELGGLFTALGLELLGIADTPAADQAQREYREWITLGYHGGMRYLADHEPLKYHPEKMLDGCRSILVFGLNYFQEAPWRPPGRRDTAGGRETAGRLARYAWGRDYHRVLGKRLRRAIRLLEERFPGVMFSYSQPIELRVAELISGVRSDVGIQIYAGGGTLDDMRRVARTKEARAS